MAPVGFVGQLVLQAARGPGEAGRIPRGRQRMGEPWVGDDSSAQGMQQHHIVVPLQGVQPLAPEERAGTDREDHWDARGVAVRGGYSAARTAAAARASSSEGPHTGIWCTPGSGASGPASAHRRALGSSAIAAAAAAAEPG